MGIYLFINILILGIYPFITLKLHLSKYPYRNVYKCNSTLKNMEKTIYSNFNRALIISILKKYGKKTPTELSNHLFLSRRAVNNHLKFLENRGLIKKEIVKDVGNPRYYELTSKAQPVPEKIMLWANNMFNINKKLKEVKNSFTPTHRPDEHNKRV